jgi:hypothetical protein
MAYCCGPTVPETWPRAPVVGQVHGATPGWLVASGHDAAVDVPDGAGDPAGGRGEQERDGVGQIAGGEDATPADGVTFLNCGPAEAVRIGLAAAGGRTSRCSRRPSAGSFSNWG